SLRALCIHQDTLPPLIGNL
ncbi:hypothetical protein AB1N83_010076, partial [Pleurotus pulmonarius]